MHAKTDQIHDFASRKDRSETRSALLSRRSTESGYRFTSSLHTHMEILRNLRRSNTQSSVKDKHENSPHIRLPLPQPQLGRL